MKNFSSHFLAKASLLSKTCPLALVASYHLCFFPVFAQIDDRVNGGGLIAQRQMEITGSDQTILDLGPAEEILAEEGSRQGAWVPSTPAATFHRQIPTVMMPVPAPGIPHLPPGQAVPGYALPGPAANAALTGHPVYPAPNYPTVVYPGQLTRHPVPSQQQQGNNWYQPGADRYSPAISSLQSPAQPYLTQPQNLTQPQTGSSTPPPQAKEGLPQTIKSNVVYQSPVFYSVVKSPPDNNRPAAVVTEIARPARYGSKTPDSNEDKGEQTRPIPVYSPAQRQSVQNQPRQGAYYRPQTVGSPSPTVPPSTRPAVVRTYPLPVPSGTSVPPNPARPISTTRQVSTRQAEARPPLPPTPAPLVRPASPLPQPSMGTNQQIITPENLRANIQTTNTQAGSLNTGPIIPANQIPAATQPALSSATSNSGTSNSGNLVSNELEEDKFSFDEFPEIEEIEEDNDIATNIFAEKQRLWSVGASFHVNGYAAARLDNYGVLGDMYGISADVSYRATDKLVIRGLGGAGLIRAKLSDADANSSGESAETELNGNFYSLHALADFHPMGNGLRVSAGPGVTFVKLDKINDTATTTDNNSNTEFTPYVGVGYDSSLFSESSIGVSAEIGGSLYGLGSTIKFFPTASIGVKYSF